jgi:uracil-DNA glycosylase
MNVRIEESWKRQLEPEFEKDYFKTLTDFVKKSYTGASIYPPPKDIFRAFDLTPFDQVKVVILGQDPYHGPRQANGLAFAVHEGVPTPPSLQNIFKELESDQGHPTDRNPDLSRWAKQGVLLLNATLTVQAGKPGSHQKKGWEEFTDAAIAALNRDKKGIVYILWGNYARQKGAFLDRTNNLVLESPHPSPFSANNGFFGSRPFSKANTYLKQSREATIDW